MDKKAFSYVLLSAILWGSTFPLVEFNLVNLNFHFFLFFLFRFLIGTIGSVILVAYLKRFHVFYQLIKNPISIAAGILNMVSIMVAYLGQKFTVAGKAALLINLNFVWVAIFSYFVFQDIPNKFKLIGLIMGGIGAYFLTIGFDIQQIMSGTIVGDLCILAAGCLWAAHVILIKILFNKNNKEKAKFKIPDIKPIDITISTISFSFIFGLIPLIGFIVFDPSINSIPTGIIPFISLIYIGFVCTTLAYLLYNKGLEKLSPVITGIILLSEVLTANALCIFLLPNQEYFTIDFILGAILIISAILISNLKE